MIKDESAREKSRTHVVKLSQFFLLACRASNFKKVLVRRKMYRPRVSLNHEHWFYHISSYHTLYEIERIEKLKLISSSFMYNI